jgi:hypothetical protein
MSVDIERYDYWVGHNHSRSVFTVTHNCAVGYDGRYTLLYRGTHFHIRSHILEL